MCGIVGYTGAKIAVPILMEGLKKLEYRGYDSAGVAVMRPDGRGIDVVKAEGRLSRLAAALASGEPLTGHCGIGHTRWATHGRPSAENSHPHASERVAVVHNGIIENYQALKQKLQRRGYAFRSETDTEVLALLIDSCYAGDPLRAIQQALLQVRGSYALGILFRDEPDAIYAVRKDSPLIVGAGDGEQFIASDVPAILSHTRQVYDMADMEIARLTPDTVAFYSLDLTPLEKESHTVTWDAQAAEKDGYEHFMMKEIHEQPAAVRNTMLPRIHDGEIDLTGDGLTDDLLRCVGRLFVVACGSAYHVGMVAKYVLEDLARVPVEVDAASEFRYRDPMITPDSLIVVISQSGETADSLAALRMARQRGAKVLAIVNVMGSSIAREADMVMYTHAGPEISVATTKAYSAQLICVYLLAVKLARLLNRIDGAEARRLVSELQALPDKIQRLLADQERLQRFAHRFSAARNAFFIGRGIDFATGLEGSLKLKEVSYVHSEAYAAGELKHGTISLIEPGTLVVGVATQPQLFGKIESNMAEVRTRGAFLMAVTPESNRSAEESADFVVYLPDADRRFSTVLAIVPLQLFAYYMSCARGLDVDKPRNLAKSVTVE
ncbi:MAG: glutamine--fructose-6-phosphate transaminase (isomerizing) [Clostridia bacterium]|nr:glutamine--fructose-6-phosphate transaminase (isomerizing) [Clostridia bacterium]